MLCITLLSLKRCSPTATRAFTGISKNDNGLSNSVLNLSKKFVLASGLVWTVQRLAFTTGSKMTVCKDVRLDGKTAVITGCNTGIGKVTVSDFYKRGCRVIMACRDLQKAEQAKQDIEKENEGRNDVGSIVVKKLDLASLKSVRECAEELVKEEKKVNLLINNAGIMMCPKMLTEDGFEMQIGTNHLGHFLFTLLLLPKLLDSTPARIVNVSSRAHERGTINFDDLQSEKSYSTFGAYSQSKLANILFTKELAKRLEGTGVTVYCLHPGVIPTDLGRHFDSAFIPGTRWLFRTLGSFFMKTIEQGAETTIYCALEPSIAKDSGLYYADCAVKEPIRRAKNMDLAEKLWDVSAELVKLGDFNPFANIKK